MRTVNGAEIELSAAEARGVALAAQGLLVILLTRRHWQAVLRL